MTPSPSPSGELSHLATAQTLLTSNGIPEQQPSTPAAGADGRTPGSMMSPHPFHPFADPFLSSSLYWTFSPFLFFWWCTRV